MAGANPEAAHAAGLADAAAHGVELGSSPAQNNAAGYDDWELDQNVRRLQARLGAWRRLDSARPQPAPRGAPRRQPQWRADAAHARVPARHRPKTRAPATSSAAAWLALAVGLMAFACGIALLVWSNVARRDELWSLGLPTAIGGQVGLLVGLVLQLERIWQTSRYAARKLDRVEGQLHHLESTASTMNVTHGTAAQAFYTHLAENANPQILLADLKGQIDMLAAELGRRL
jgi:hypothetical protein